MGARSRNWLLILAALLVLALASVWSRPEPVRTAYFDGPTPMVIAHQGGDGLRPSNTMLAFQHAVDLGVDVLEMDVQQSADGELVLMHDDTVDRTTDGSGPIAAMTLAELRRLDAAYHWPYTGSERPYRGLGVRVPTLDEVLTRFPQMRFNIEIKPDGPQTARALCEHLQAAGLGSRTLVASFHPEAMGAFRGACPGVATSAYESEAFWSYVRVRLGLWRWIRNPVLAVQVPPESRGIDLTAAAFLDAARRAGLHVDIWTVNDSEQMRRLAARGVGGIITDRPDRLLAVLGRGG
ncbi:MAG: glycerophosphodiester phosphodiesterase [Pseudomonadales bacterium]